MTSSVRFAGKPPARFKSSNLPERGFPPSCMAAASRKWKGSWISGGQALRKEAKDRSSKKIQLDRDRRLLRFQCPHRRMVTVVALLRSGYLGLCRLV